MEFRSGFYYLRVYKPNLLAGFFHWSFCLKKIKSKHRCFGEDNEKHIDGEINTCFDISSAISSAIPVPAFNRQGTTVRKSSLSDSSYMKTPPIVGIHLCICIH
jgi:hypothetical protein